MEPKLAGLQSGVRFAGIDGWIEPTLLKTLDQVLAVFAFGAAFADPVLEVV